MQAGELYEELGRAVDGEVVVKVGDQMFKVQTVVGNDGYVMLTLGGDYKPAEGGGVRPADGSVVIGDLQGRTPPTFTPERDAQSTAGELPHTMEDEVPTPTPQEVNASPVSESSAWKSES